MIMGFFLVRPIPLPVQATSDIESAHQLEGISSALEPHNSSRTPLLDNGFAGGLHSHSAVLRTGVKSGRIDEDVYTLDDIPFRSANGVFIPPPFQSIRSNRDIPHPKPNLHGRQLWTSSEFWLLFTILAIRESLLFPPFVVYAITNMFITFLCFFVVSGTGLMCTLSSEHAVDDGLKSFFLVDINNVGTISQVLYAHKNSEYDPIKASDWQGAQVSLISLMSFSGRILIGKFHPYYALPSSYLPLFKYKGLISDLVKNKYKLPRSYLLVPIAALFFVSQLILATVGNITRLWIASSLLGLAHGCLYSLYPTVCLEWFGMGTSPSFHTYCLYPNPFFLLFCFGYWFLSSTAHFSENWGYLGMSLLVGGNIFSLVFGRNLDAHDGPSTSHPHSSVDPVQCSNGLDCYVAAIYLTMAATLVSILLCAWAGYREKKKIAKLLFTA